MRVQFLVFILVHLILIDAYFAFLNSKDSSSCHLPKQRSGMIQSINNREYIRQCTSNMGKLFPIKNLESFKNLRNVFHISNAIVILLCIFSVPHFSNAKDLESSVPIYRSGKNPDPLSNSNKDSKVGTKKDINFLRCMSNCKSQCQMPGEGLVKTDCVQDCQDQCCDSYEQCSFKIKINTGNSI
jgi:hypothetical protein